MNVSELARKLKITTTELLEILPKVGFDIGKKAIKIDDRTAHKITQNWSYLLSQYKKQNLPVEETKIEETKTAIEKTVALPAFIRVKDFALKLNLPLPKIMAELLKNGVLTSMNEQIDFDTASIIAQDFGFEVTVDNTSAKQEEEKSSRLETLLQNNDKNNLQPRPPVVVVMGHVDHGKTKLLDAIRKTNVVDKEFGGITQHIGAYQVIKQNKPITFIDTPGHEAFTTMRSRGARVADIAILVVAADDGVQPQTKESIKIIHSAGLPMIVAINKIDKPEANPEKIKQELAALDLTPEEWGGQTICVPVSAKAGTGIEELLEMILLVAATEKENIMADPNLSAIGTIIESHLDKGEGPVATILIQSGTLKNGDLIMISDSFYGKIRAMKDFKGEDVKIAPPSMPVKILGLKAAPSVGDIMQVAKDIDRKSRIKKYQLNEQATAYTKPLEMEKQKKENIRALNLIIKADVLGSLEAIIASLAKLEHPEVSINIIAKGLGNINESDVQRAKTAPAMILGFNVKPTTESENSAKEAKVEIRLYNIIYKLLEDVKAELEKLLSPEVIKTELGRLKVLAVFRAEKNEMVLGGLVTKGKLLPRSKVEIFRNEIKLGVSDIVGLQANKVSVNEVSQGQECGVKYEGKVKVEKGDILEAYLEEVKAKKIS